MQYSRHFSPGIPFDIQSPWRAKRVARIAFLLAFLLLGSFSAARSQPPPSSPDPQVRVRITGVKSASITLFCRGEYDFVDAATGSLLATATDSEATVTAKGSGLGVTIAGQEIDTSALGRVLRIVPKSPDSVADLQPGGRKPKQYTGTLEIAGGRALMMIDELPLEEYVRGVIPAEIASRSSREAQKALVVAIRTYALKSMEKSRHKADGYHLCDTVDCQGFSGVPAPSVADWVDGLIAETRGQVVTYHGDLICALYSTDCGGCTQGNKEAGIGNRDWPYLRPVIDRPAVPPAGQPIPASDAAMDPPDYCSTCPDHLWTRSYTRDQLAKAFAKCGVGPFVAMEFSEYDSSGRVMTVLIKGESREKRISGNEFRRMFGLSTIKSTRMTLTATPEGVYRIDGRGYGHGLGMCAAGANGFAKANPRATYIDILKRYYTGVDVTTLNGLRIPTPDAPAEQPQPTQCAPSVLPDMVQQEKPVRTAQAPVAPTEPSAVSSETDDDTGIILRGRAVEHTKR